MGTVEVFTKARMQTIEDSTVVAGEVNLDGDLILETRDGTPINAGHVKGADGSDATVPMATTSEAGKAFIASSTEVNTGTDASKIVTPATLNSRTATETRTGLVELATSAEVIAGTDTQRAVTPAGLFLLTATDARRGLVELATEAETIAGTDSQRAVTPQGLRGVIQRGPRAIVPSSVQVASGSATVESDGTVVFSGASRVSLNGVFDGLGMDTYEVYGFLVGTTNGAIYTRMRQSGTDRTGNVYNYVGNYTSNGLGPARASTFGINLFGFWWPNTFSNTPASYGKMTIFRPAQLTQTQIIMQSGTSASDRVLWHEYGDATSAIEDGFSIQATAGTLTGRVKVLKIA